MTNPKKVIKIIPTYNEKENISALASAIFEHMPETSILVVDDNSPDGTGKIVQDLSQKYPRLMLHQRTQDRGFGRSYLDGFNKIKSDPRYETIVMMDADFSHDPLAVPAMLSKLESYDLVVGSRYVKGGRIDNWKSKKRKILSRFANIYARTILGVPVNDVTTGFMCFRKSVLDKIDLDSIKSDGYAFLVEMKYRVFKAGYKICEHPIVFNERREGQSKMSTKVIWESVWLPWKLKWQKK